MQWSRLKSTVESFFAASLDGRVELRSVRYRGAHDQAGRGYITVDGEEVWNMCTWAYSGARERTMNALVREQQVSGSAARALADERLVQDGVMDQGSFYASLEDYCHAPVESSLRSQSPLVRSLALLDARVGKRRLAKWDVSNEHPMVQFFFRLRCEAEGIRPRGNSSENPPTAS